MIILVTDPGALKTMDENNKSGMWGGCYLYTEVQLAIYGGWFLFACMCNAITKCKSICLIPGAFLNVVFFFFTFAWSIWGICECNTSNLELIREKDALVCSLTPDDCGGHVKIYRLAMTMIVFNMFTICMGCHCLMLTCKMTKVALQATFAKPDPSIKPTA